MTRKRRRYTVLFGAMGGYLVRLTSIGSGSIIAIILLLLYPLAPAVVVGTDIAHATVLSLVTGLAHASQGNVDWGASPGRSCWAAYRASSWGAASPLTSRASP